MSALIIYVDTIPPLDPLPRYPAVPTAGNESDAVPLCGETSARPSVSGGLTGGAVRSARIR
jgi:hypothetical protein